MNAATITGLFTVVWAFATTSTALWAVIRPRRSPRRTSNEERRLVVLRPCAGDEPELERALSSSAAARSPVRILIATAADSAGPTASRVAGEIDEAIVVTTGACGPNAKADQLARALARESDSWDAVLVADSDVELSPTVVRALREALEHADCAWAPPVEVLPTTFADRVSAAILGASLHSFPLLARLDPGGIVGKTFAIRRDALASIGGFDSLVGSLGEDMELARRLRASSRRVVAVPEVAHSLARGRDLRALVRRYTRWLLVIRAQRPALLLTYPLVLAAAPLQVLAASLAIAGGAELGWLVLAFVVAGRYATAALAQAAGPSGTRLPLVFPWLADVVLLSALVGSVLSRRAHWRGASLRVDRDGALVESP